MNIFGKTILRQVMPPIYWYLSKEEIPKTWFFFKNMNNLTPRINHVLMYPQNIGLQLKFATYLPSILSSINNAVHIFSKIFLPLGKVKCKEIFKMHSALPMNFEYYLSI